MPFPLFPGRLAAILAGCALLPWLAVGSARADDTFTDLYDFTGVYQRTVQGGDPRLLQASDGNFYGVTSGDQLTAGQTGAIFRLTPDGTLTSVHVFSGGPDGANPGSALLQASDGNFYGTTSRGGANNVGTFFRLTPDGTLTTLYSFDPVNDSYGLRTAPVLGNDGNFYGVTNGVTTGGDGNAGTFYRITPAGVFTTLHRFDGSVGTCPNSTPILGGDGNFYGTMSYYGNHLGAIYRITPDGTPMLLHAFLDFTEGTTPGPLLAGRDGNLYGTTTGGGPGDSVGVVYRLAPDGGGFSVLHGFGPTAAGYLPDGDGPINGLSQDADGNLYGATSYGFENDDKPFYGTLFRLAPDGTLTTLHKFKENGYNAGPLGTPLLAGDGRLYGQTGVGGTNTVGYAFRVTTDSVAPVVPLPVDFYVPAVDLEGIRSDKITDTELGGFQFSPSTAQTIDLKVNYEVTGTGQPGVDYVALKGVVKIKAGKTFKDINLIPIAIPHVPGQRKTVKTVKITLLPGDGYELRPEFTTRKVKITHP